MKTWRLSSYVICSFRAKTMVKERNIVWAFNCSFIPICAPQNGNISDRQTDQRDGCLQLIQIFALF